MNDFIKRTKRSIKIVSMLKVILLIVLVLTLSIGQNAVNLFAGNDDFIKGYYAGLVVGVLAGLLASLLNYIKIIRNESSTKRSTLKVSMNVII